LNSTSSQKYAVDICVPVYNAGEFIQDTIESILAQEFADFRLLISVDQSTDNSAALCRKFIGDKRVELVEQTSRLGFVGNSNFLMRAVEAPYMKFVPHDDLAPKDLVGTLFSFMQETPDCAIAIPMLKGFGEQARDFDQFEVRGPVLRRLLDIIMNQRSVAAYHGLVRVDCPPDLRPMLPTGYLRDFEVDVYWMAMAAKRGELRRVSGAAEHKRFRAGMTSRSWVPKATNESRQLLVQHTARLAELAFSVCENAEQRQQTLMAALVRLRGLGLNWGVANARAGQFFFRARMNRLLRRSLTGDCAEFARNVSFYRLGRALHQDEGIVGASLLARQLEMEIDQLDRGKGDSTRAEKLYAKALAMDPYAGWAVPFSIRSLAGKADGTAVET
jgi:hypothetical protein